MSENSITRFHFGHERGLNSDPNYGQGYGYDYPRLRAYGNITYLQLIDIVTHLWEKAHPEVKIVPYGNRAVYNPDQGTIVYNLDQKTLKSDNTKARFQEDIAITDEGEFKIRTLSQTFTHLIEFTAVHRDPRVAEEIIEAFEDFMVMVTPEIKGAGAEEFIFNRRVSDRDMTRFGEDVASRSVMYMANLQKMYMVKPELLESIQIEVRILLEQATPEFNEILFLQIPPENDS